MPPSQRDLSPDEVPEQIWQVACLLAEGLNDKAAAATLGIDARTVRRRVSRLMEVLEASTRFQAGYRLHAMEQDAASGTLELPDRRARMKKGPL